jgi:hypothetical protein
VLGGIWSPALSVCDVVEGSFAVVRDLFAGGFENGSSLFGGRSWLSVRISWQAAVVDGLGAALGASALVSSSVWGCMIA